MGRPHEILVRDAETLFSADLPWERLHGRHVLVTGASGFIGGNIVEMLVLYNRRYPHARIRVHALSRSLEALRMRLSWVLIPEEIAPVILDVVHPCPASQPADFIIHAASPADPAEYLKKPVDTIRANSEGTLNMLELARRNRAVLLFLSSGVVYGGGISSATAIRETDFGGDDPLSPRACYSQSKRMGETLCRAFFSQYGTDTRIARISHTYGPGMRLDDRRAMPAFLADVLDDSDIRMDSDGSAARPFCYISDTISGLLHILLKGRAGEAWNVGSEIETTIAELAEKVIAISGRKYLKVRGNALPGLAPPARSEGHFCTAKLRSLGWKDCVSLEEGLKRTLAFCHAAMKGSVPC
ncbi:MAG: NAD-dependent epimerase/dehydratase family protein [Candidatus Accumulibacter sp.]|jgi:dTDP-glucose 4,6-dehydratase|nr:NAD-dependent epimerase/dehydratase family protein [Accumulibacter sp.]